MSTIRNKYCNFRYFQKVIFKSRPAIERLRLNFDIQFSRTSAVKFYVCEKSPIILKGLGHLKISITKFYVVILCKFYVCEKSPII